MCRFASRQAQRGASLLLTHFCDSMMEGLDILVCCEELWVGYEEGGTGNDTYGVSKESNGSTFDL